MYDFNVTRYPGGVTNQADNSPLGDMKVTDRTIYHEFYDDFDRYTAAQYATGGVNPVVPALIDGEGGVLSVAGTGAANDSAYVSALNLAYSLSSAKRLFFRARGQVDNATLSAMAFGLQIAPAANNFLTPADGLFLRKPAAETNVYLVHRVGGVEIVSSAVGSIADATSFSVEFSLNGNNVVAGVNNRAGASITVPTYTAVALKPIAGCLGSTAAKRTLLLDFIYCAKER